jgi:DNA (cytosine-5)-methyltransferase 1
LRSQESPNKADTLLVTHALKAEGFDASEDGTGRGVPLVANPVLAGGHATNPLDETLLCLSSGQANAEIVRDGSPSLTCLHEAPIVAFAQNQREELRELEVAGALAGIRRGDAKNETLLGFADVADPVAANQGRTYTREGSNNFRLSNVAHTGAMVRRLTPRECERLQGFPDDYTLIPYRGKPAADGPRYKALGNSMAVPVMRWIGSRIDLVEALP